MGEHSLVVGADGAAVVAVGGFGQGDAHLAVADGVNLDVPALVTALGLPVSVGDGGAADGEGVVPDPGVAGVHVLAEVQLEGEVLAVMVGWHVGEARCDERHRRRLGGHGRCGRAGQRLGVAGIVVEGNPHLDGLPSSVETSS